MRDTIISLSKSLFLHAFIGFIIGLIIDAPFLLMLLGLLIWCARTIYWISHLNLWAQTSLNKSPPDIPGPLGEVSYRFIRYQRAEKKRQARLKTVINRFQQSASSMSDAIVIIDQNSEIEWWNQAGSELLGLLETDRGQPILNLMRNPDFVSYYQSPNNQHPIEAKSSDNRRILEYRIHYFGDGNRVLVARDITEREKLEQVRRDFVANASHELRTPLTVIHGYLETLQDQELKPVIKKAIDTMYRQSSRMEALVSDLLTLSKLESNTAKQDKTPINIAQMLTQITTQARELSAEKSHEITLSIAPNLDILGSAKELHSALSNLVFNAVRYTPANGKIDIALARMGKGAVFTVTDTGVGIASHHIPRITERFYRVDEGRSRESGGTGLGLAIVKHVLARHNSTLGVSSKQNEGSRFSCVFPASRTIELETFDEAR